MPEQKKSAKTKSRAALPKGAWASERMLDADAAAVAELTSLRSRKKKFGVNG
jgi:hypothetical protein